MRRLDWKEVVRLLKSGAVVVIPTETSYGLAADALNPRAVRRMAAIKQREPGKTPPLIVADMKMAEEYVELTEPLRRLAKKYWPGALTIVGKVKKGLASGVVRSDGTIAMRVSDFSKARLLARALKGPMVATSANVAGQPPCFSVPMVRRQFKGRLLQPDAYWDIGALPHREATTIVKERRGKIVVVRKGSIKI